MDAAQDLGEQVAAGSRPVTAAAAVSSATGADEPASAEECLDIAVADTEDALELLAAAAGGEETAPGTLTSWRVLLGATHAASPAEQKMRMAWVHDRTRGKVAAVQDATVQSLRTKRQQR